MCWRVFLLVLSFMIKNREIWLFATTNIQDFCHYKLSIENFVITKQIYFWICHHAYLIIIKKIKEFLNINYTLADSIRYIDWDSIDISAPLLRRRAKPTSLHWFRSSLCSLNSLRPSHWRKENRREELAGTNQAEVSSDRSEEGRKEEKFFHSATHAGD
jgi:hypothetical protein